MSTGKRQARHAVLAAILFFFLSVGASGCAASLADEETLKQAEYHYQLGSNHFGAGEVAQAIRELVLALELSPVHPDAQHLLGFIYMGRKQYPEAIRHFRAALEARPDYFPCKNNLGVALLYMERWEEAATIFAELRTATLYTSPWLAYANLGWAHYQMGRVDEAIEETKMALFLNPDMCLASNNLGVMYTARQDPESALSSLEDAIELCPGYAEPHLHLAQLSAELGDGALALEHFRRCEELSPRTELGKRCQRNARMYR